MDALLTPDQIVDFLFWAEDYYSVEGLIVSEDRDTLKELIDKWVLKNEIK